MSGLRDSFRQDRANPFIPTEAHISRQFVAVVAFDHISPFHLSVSCLVFDQECYDPCAQAFDLCVCAAEPSRLRTTAGFTIEAGAGLGALAEAQTVIVLS